MARIGHNGAQRPVVAHIHPNYLPLSETFIHRSISALQDFSPQVLTQRVVRPHVHDFQGRYPVIQTASKGWKSKAVAKILRAVSSRLRDYSAVHATYSELIRQRRPRILHAHFGHVGWFCLPLRRLHRLPLVVSFHGADGSSMAQEPIWRERFRELFLESDLITVPSDFLAQNLVRLGCPESRIRIVHYGLDLEDWPFQGPARKGVAENSTQSIQLLLVARFVEKKGIPYALHATNRLRRRFPGVQLNIVGEGAMGAELGTLIAELKLDEWVNLQGPLTSEQVRQLMQTSDILIVPSVTASNSETEGLPNVVIEACATGIPVVATFHAGIPEIIEDGVSGYLVKERDSVALAERLATLIEDPSLRKEMGEAGRRIVEQEFDSRQSAKRLEGLYRELLGDSRRSISKVRT